MRPQCTPGLRRVHQPSILKAARLIAEHRVHLAAEARVYLVDGDTDCYRVIAGIDGIFCPCEARTPLCAHVLAVAQLHENQRLAVIGEAA